ncbi:hypothetical protein [Tsukamurella soli]|uniref:hypothetical protein n=1 Tax=Tsukamurella soli TaxID=644556 RepID=UPI0031E81E50
MTLTREVAGPDAGVTLPGMDRWVITYCAEAGARRMVAKLLQGIAPGLDPADVYAPRLDRASLAVKPREA